jgi:hypothetical protein
MPQLTIKSLFKIHKDETIYIVGTGPSMRVFPLDFLSGKITIGLNQAFKFFQPIYSITVHPYLIPYDHTTWNCKWLTKVKPTCEGWLKHVAKGNRKHFYLYENNDKAEDFSYFHNGNSYKLFVGRGIQTGAIHIAALMGAKNCILVGCDCCQLDFEHHALDQHTEFHGHPDFEIYQEYYYYTVKCRELALQKFSMRVLSLTPFIGLPLYEKDYEHQKQFLKLEKLPPPKDIERAKRHANPIKNYLK